MKLPIAVAATVFLTTLLAASSGSALTADASTISMPQSESRPLSTRKWQLTPTVGATYFTHTGGTAKGSKFIDGMRAGAALEINLREKLSLETGLDYVQSGVKKQRASLLPAAFFGNSASALELNIKQEYLYVPAMAKYYLIGSARRPSLAIKGGTWLGYLLESEANATNTGFKQSLTDSYRSYDALLSLALAGRIPLNEKTLLTLEGAASQGLVNVNEGGEVYNSGFSLIGGLNIQL